MILLASLLAFFVQEEETPPPFRQAGGARYRLWLANLDGSARSDGEAVEGTDVKLSTDLGLDQAAVFHDLGGWVRIPGVGNVRASWLFGGFEESETLDGSLSFGGETFSGGTRVDTEFDVHLITALFEFELWGPEEFGIDAGIWLQVGGKFAILSTVITSSASKAEGDATGFLPAIGARGGVSFGDLIRTEIEINGLILPLGETELRFIDLAVEVGVTPWEGLYAGIGYHVVYVFLHSESGDEVDEVDFALHGIYFFAGWRF